MEKEILKFLGIDDAKSVEEFKEKFNTSFVPKSDLDAETKKLSDATGKITGGFATHAKRVFGLTNEEIKDKKWEDILELASTKLTGEVEELKKNQGQGNDKALEKALAEAEKIKKERDEFKAAHETTQSLLEKTTGEYEGKLKGLKVGSIFESAKSKVYPKLKSDMSPAEKLGYEASINDFVVDFDDKDTPIVKDKAGNMLKNPNKAGSFLSLEEALESKAAELNLIKKNNGQGGQHLNPAFFQHKKEEGGGDPTKNPAGRTIHPNALKATGK